MVKSKKVRGQKGRFHSMATTSPNDLLVQNQSKTNRKEIVKGVKTVRSKIKGGKGRKNIKKKL